MLKKDNGLQWNSECIDALRELKAYLSSSPLLAKAEPGERLLIYLAVSEVTASAALVYENKGKLRTYFQCHPILVVTTFPLRLSGRLVKWAIELSKHNITYQPRTMIKSQVIADFVTDFRAKIMLEVEQEASHTPPGQPNLWVQYTDDASNASGSRLRLVLEVPTSEIIGQSIRFPNMTNNEAEYEAVIAGLKLALKYSVRRVLLRCDSQSVVNQVTRDFQIKEQRLQKYQAEIHKLLSEFDECRLDHIPRVQNIEADSLPKLATTTKNIAKEDMVTVLHSSIDQLEEGVLPQYKKEAKKLRMQATRYIITNHDLYKRTFGGILAKCLGLNQTRPVLEEVHGGHCGAHTGNQALVRCLIRVGYYWSTMKKKATDYVK
uniref:Uncharacterized protein LOC104232965 n=1 Tax=Nicotiana sylvestris TaxID=4096 RepID=A0A1U7XC80_NICSY